MLLNKELIPGGCTPHYDDIEANPRPDFQRLVENGDLPAGIGIDDGAAILFEGQQLVEVVASSAGSKAYRVKLEQGKVIEEPLEARLLDTDEVEMFGFSIEHDPTV